ERVLVRSDLLPEHRQSGIAVPLPEVAENLVVGPVLLEHEDDVLDRRAVTDLDWHDTSRNRLRRREAVVFRNLAGVLFELLAVGQRDRRERALHEQAHVLPGLSGADAEALHIDDEETPG